MKVIKNVEEFEALVASGKKVFVDMYADWCGPCKMLAPVLEEVSKSFEDVTFVKVNVDELQELAMQFGVMSIPTLLMFKDGSLVKKSVGFMPKPSVEALVKSL